MTRLRQEATPGEPGFDGAAEPMRAIRDLISDCEAGAFEGGNPDVLARAQAAFTTLRALHGDARPAEDIAFAAMREPDLDILPLTADALPHPSSAYAKASADKPPAHPAPPAQICAGSAGTGICEAPADFGAMEFSIAEAMQGDGPLIVSDYPLIDGPLKPLGGFTGGGV